MKQINDNTMNLDMFYEHVKAIQNGLPQTPNQHTSNPRISISPPPKQSKN